MSIETFIEFTFEAAHSLPPFAGLHGHSFKVTLYFQGRPDPTYGWSHNLYEVESAIHEVKREIDHTHLNDFIPNPSLENVAQWLWRRFDSHIAGLDRLVLTRGRDGSAEGCTCWRPAPAEATLAA